MQTISTELLATVTGGESLGQVLGQTHTVTDAPLAQTYGATKDFIRDHSFFHQGLMNAPIGGGKHFRNVPFIGPFQMAKGAVTGNSETIAKGWQVTRGSWDAA